MFVVWSAAMRAGGLTLTWTSLLWSDPSEPVRPMAAWWVALYVSFASQSFPPFFYMLLKLLFFCHRRRLCRHSSSQKPWMGPTSTSVNAAKRNVTPGRWANRKTWRRENTVFCSRPSWSSDKPPPCTGPEVSALSLPADTTAEEVRLRLHHYASHQTEWPHDFPRGARHESVHWCGGWGESGNDGTRQIYIRLIGWQINEYWVG